MTVNDGEICIARENPMTHRIRVSVCASLALALAGSACCKKAEESPPTPQPLPAERTTAKPATQPATTAAHPVPTAAKPSTAGQKSRPMSEDNVSALTKKIAAGHTIHPQHSFELNLKGFEGSMLATTGPNKTTFVFHFFDAAGKRVTSVFDKEMDGIPSTKLLAVAFEDVDRDGFEDLVVLGGYLSARNEYNSVAVYTRSGGGPFRFQEKLGQRAGNAPSMAAALAKLR